MANALLKPSLRSPPTVGAALDHSAPSRVAVWATARLHLGFLDLHGGLGRQFGSLGMALDGPETRVVLRRSTHAVVTGQEVSRAERVLHQFESALGLSSTHALDVMAAIPAHAGLGSGTQLALSIAAALRRLHGLPADPPTDAALLGRGLRSGIGIALFGLGGLVVDGGRGAATTVPPLLAHLPVPRAWRVLLLRDPGHQGLFGEQEKAAFQALPPTAENDAGRLCRLVLMQVLPALAECDLPRFGHGIAEIQRIVGRHFAPAQGGLFASPLVGAALQWLGQEGVVGIGQTSWGPSGFAFTDSDASAEQLLRALAATRHGTGLLLSIHRPLNRGALIEAD